MITIPMTVAVTGVTIPMIMEATTVEFSTGIGAAYSMQQNAHYDGEYTFTPTQEQQTVQTAGLVVDQDIIIEPIPSNYGLITWDGSVLTVS